MEHLPQTSPKGFRRGARKIVRNRGAGQAEGVLQTQGNRCTYELTGIMTACTSPERAQARENPSREWGEGGVKSHP